MKDFEDDELFIAHGYYTVTNSYGYEIELSQCGSCARIKDGEKITEWFEIEYILDDDDDDDDEATPIIDPQGYNISLNLVMRRNNNN